MSHQTQKPRRTLKPVGDILRVAEFSPCHQYRYMLRIRWNLSGQLLQFIGLNPSSANADVDDPTVRRCKDFARTWGYAGIEMTNLFPLVATDPTDMLFHEKPLGEPVTAPQFDVEKCASGGITDRNDAELVTSAESSPLVVCCWGKIGRYKGRADKVTEMLMRFVIPLKLQCLGYNEDGSPKHPLYLSGKTELQTFVWPR